MESNRDALEWSGFEGMGGMGGMGGFGKRLAEYPEQQQS